MDDISDNIFKCNFLNENIQILINISLKFITKGQINNIPSLVQIIVWCGLGDKPLSEPIMVIYWRIYASLGLNELMIISSYVFKNLQLMHGIDKFC